jgi:hypothetical protein
MRVVLGTIAGFLLWFLLLAFLPDFLSGWGNAEPPAPASVFVLSCGASVAGLWAARSAAEALSKHDPRAHAYTLVLAVLVCVGSILAARGALLLTISGLGALIGCIFDWRTSGASFSKAKRPAWRRAEQEGAEP